MFFDSLGAVESADAAGFCIFPCGRSFDDDMD